VSTRLAGVTVRLGSVTALDDVDLAVRPGRIEAVIGPDAAGKSTLARVLVGLVAATSGTVDSPPRSRLGYQPESAGTWRDLSVGENLDFVARSHGRDPSGQMARRIDDLLAVTALGGAVDRLAGDLSGGMRQKLAIAMAMLPQPDLLVLDEPTTGLDPVSRADVWRLLARAAGEGAAIVATTAYLDEAQRADHVTVLDHGRVLVAGRAEDIRASFPGRLVAGTARDPDHPSWRRGRSWRTWLDADVPDVPDEADDRPVLEPDLEDVVMAASLRRRDEFAEVGR